MANIVKTEENLQWIELCDWVATNIFNYDCKVQCFQTEACLILRGLKHGQIIANNKCKKQSDYPFNIILMTFKANMITIQNAIKNKKFGSEEQKMLYVCAIVRDKIDDMYKRFLNAQKTNKV